MKITVKFEISDKDIEELFKEEGIELKEESRLLLLEKMGDMVKNMAEDSDTLQDCVSEMVDDMPESHEPKFITDEQARKMMKEKPELKGYWEKELQIRKEEVLK